MNKQITFKNPRVFNVIAAFLYLGQSIAVLLLSKSFTLPISGSYLTFNPAMQSFEQTIKVFAGTLRP